MATVHKRGDTWRVRFRHDGEHVRRSAKTIKKAVAQAYLHRLMEEYRTPKKVEQRYMLTEAVEAFFEGSSLKTSTLETYRFNSRVVIRLLVTFILTSSIEGARRLHCNQEADWRHRCNGTA